MSERTLENRAGGGQLQARGAVSAVANEVSEPLTCPTEYSADNSVADEKYGNMPPVMTAAETDTVFPIEVSLNGTGVDSRGRTLILGTGEFVKQCRSLDRRSLPYRFVKRLFDLVFSTCVIAIGLLPGLLLSLAIVADTKASPIYSQVRVGRLGRTFRIYKFRTMVADSDDIRKYLDEKQLVQWHLERKVDDDPRITPLGQKLRQLSVAPVIIGTPGDGELTKSSSHPVNSPLDLHKCERRPEPFLVAQTHNTSFQFLSIAFSGGLGAARGRSLCARGAAPSKDFRAVA